MAQPAFPYRLTVYAAVGCLWSLVALVVNGGQVGEAMIGGLLAGPVIGMAIGLLFEGFEGRERPERIFLALVSMYGAVTLFGAGIGLAEYLNTGSTARLFSSILESVFGALWYVTFAGWFLLLWPLSYATHSLLGRWRSQERHLNDLTRGAEEARRADADPA